MLRTNTNAFISADLQQFINKNEILHSDLLSIVDKLFFAYKYGSRGWNHWILQMGHTLHFKVNKHLRLHIQHIVWLKQCWKQVYFLNSVKKNMYISVCLTEKELNISQLSLSLILILSFILILPLSFSLSLSLSPKINVENMSRL